MNCPLCLESTTENFFSKLEKLVQKNYLHCETCDLIFLDPSHYLSAEEEESRYLEHNNDITDQRYRAYLLSTLLPIRERLVKEMKILDYGCGPTESLSILLREEGYQSSSYDPYFFPFDLESENEYHLIILSECIEHFYHPAKEFIKLKVLLKETGHLLIRTERHNGKEMFANWYYHKDPTHVIFFSERTFQYVALMLQMKVEFPSKNIVILRL
ncbi:MAG: class I SAM-dependent methyltransferase [Bacteriovoracaceae bacterium]